MTTVPSPPFSRVLVGHTDQRDSSGPPGSGVTGGVVMSSMGRQEESSGAKDRKEDRKGYNWAEPLLTIISSLGGLPAEEKCISFEVSKANVLQKASQAGAG